MLAVVTARMSHFGGEVVVSLSVLKSLGKSPVGFGRY